MNQHFKLIKNCFFVIMLCVCNTSFALTTSWATNIVKGGQVLDHSCGYGTCQKYGDLYYFSNDPLPISFGNYQYGQVSSPLPTFFDPFNNRFISSLSVIKGLNAGSYSFGMISTAIGNTYAVVNSSDGSLYTGGGISGFHVKVAGTLFDDLRYAGSNNWILDPSISKNSWLGNYTLWIANPGIFDGWYIGDLSALIDGATTDLKVQDPDSGSYSSTMDYFFSTPSSPFSWLVNLFMTSDANFTTPADVGNGIGGILSVTVEFISPDGTNVEILQPDDPRLLPFINQNPGGGGGQTISIDEPDSLMLMTSLLFLLSRRVPFNFKKQDVRARQRSIC